MSQYYLRYMTPGKKVKEKWFATDAKRQAFILASKCTVLERRDFD
jgi:hypothetical protein